MNLESIQKAEEQIYQLRKSVRYDIRELTIEILTEKYSKGIEYAEDSEDRLENKVFNVIYIPDYQRDFTWDEVRQSRFVESVILGLPVPLIFVAENQDSAWEIVDGSQRVRTLAAFVNNKLKLVSLTKLTHLNDFYFKDLDKSRQGKIFSTPIRMIVLSEDADDEIKRDMFDRINKGSDLLKPMETRKGTIKGAFTDFIYETVANTPLFIKHAPVDKWLVNRQEREELLLRFFALSENENYKHYPAHTGINKYLDDYLRKKNNELKVLDDMKREQQLNEKRESLNTVLNFVDKYSAYGFRKNHNPVTKRVIFEAISVGVFAALKENADVQISKEKFLEILNSQPFKQYWFGNYEVHNPDRIKGRIDFIANSLLGK